jgi:hypothetical protein
MHLNTPKEKKTEAFLRPYTADSGMGYFNSLKGYR